MSWNSSLLRQTDNNAEPERDRQRLKRVDTRNRKATVCSIWKHVEGDPKRFPRHENGQYLGIGKVTVRTLQSQDAPLNEACARLGVSLRQTEDQLMRDTLSSTSATINAVGGTNADLPTEMTYSDIMAVIKALRGNSAYTFLDGLGGENKFGTAPVRDAYFGLGHTDLIGTLDNVNSFINKWSYPGLTSNLESEYGSVANVRFCLSPVASVTQSASLLGQPVYNTFICGRESFCAIEQDRYSAQFVYRDPILNDALAMNCSVGWKAMMAFRITNSQWVFNLRSTLAA